MKKMITTVLILSSLSAFASHEDGYVNKCKKFTPFLEETDCKYQGHYDNFTALGWFMEAGLNGTPSECIEQAKEFTKTRKMIAKARVLYRDQETCKIIKVRIK